MPRHFDAIVTGVLRSALRISPRDVEFANRGFHAGESHIRKHLEHIGAIFVYGYGLALEDRGEPELAREISRMDPLTRGFAFEGAAMALALLDRLAPGSGRLPAFIGGAGEAHEYMVLVGEGWAIGRVPWLRYAPERAITGFREPLHWLAIDGYGFHEGYFRTRERVERQRKPRGLSAAGQRAFDQGLGRSLWFSQCADVERIATTIGRFSEERRADLWSGAGLACAYAGGVRRAAVEALHVKAGAYSSRLAVGAAFAAKARQRAGNPAPHTAMGCDVFAGMSCEEAAAITDETLRSAPEDYMMWQERIAAAIRSVSPKTNCEVSS